MVQAILELFTTEQKATEMLANPIIEFIFMILFVMFMITILIHIALFTRLRTIRNHIKQTNSLDIEPLKSFKEQFLEQRTESIDMETFVQEKFSSWRVFKIPVIHLIKMIQATVSVFILIGVLGTFIGLTISLGSINSSSEQLVENVASVLSGIDVAFYTSIVGMGASLIMTLFVKVFNTEYMLTDIMLMVESNIVDDEQHGIGRLINVSEAINDSILKLQSTHEQSLQGIIDAFAGFKDYTKGLQQSAKDLAVFNDGLSQNLGDFQVLFQEMETVTDGFSKGTTKLNENFDMLFSYFEKSDQKNERIAKAFEETYENMQEVTKSQISSLMTFEDIAQKLQQFMTAISEKQSGVHKHMDRTSNEIKHLVEMIGTHNEEFKQIFGDNLSGELYEIASNLGDLSSDFDLLGDSIGQLPQALELINKTQHQYRHLLTDRFDELKEFNQRFGQHIQDHSSESASFERQMRKLSTTFEQLGMRNSQLIQEMNTTLTQMDRTFNQRENQMEASVNVLKDALAQYVNNVEGTLSSKLEQIIRQIESSMGQTTEGIQRELSEIRHLNENIQQNNVRFMQQLTQEIGREMQILNRNLATQQQQPIRVGWNQNDT